MSTVRVNKLCKIMNLETLKINKTFYPNKFVVSIFILIRTQLRHILLTLRYFKLTNKVFIQDIIVSSCNLPILSISDKFFRFLGISFWVSGEASPRGEFISEGSAKLSPCGGLIFESSGMVSSCEEAIFFASRHPSPLRESISESSKPLSLHGEGRNCTTIEHLHFIYKPLKLSKV